MHRPEAAQLEQSTVPPPEPPPFQRSTFVIVSHVLPPPMMSAAEPAAREYVNMSSLPLESSHVTTTFVGDTKVALLHALCTALGCAAAKAAPGSSVTALLLPPVGAAAPPMRTSTRAPAMEDWCVVTANSWPPYSST